MLRLKRRGFTLIELLIVVAIIAILAAIAVPNFLEAQLRSKVSRVKADMRSIAVALEAYAVDNNAYPITRLPGYYATPLITGINAGVDGGIGNVPDLTTPVAYLTSVFIMDPFVPPMASDQWGFVPQLRDATGPVSRTIYYANITEYRRLRSLAPVDVQWILISFGPDMKRGPVPGVATPGATMYSGITTGRTPAQEQYFVRALYDPTNGTVSGGDIFMYQGRSFY